MTFHNPFKAVAAMSLNRVIGVQNRIPWHLPDDFKWFKKLTTGQVVIMGRKTFESIGKPLPNRQTIVVTRSTAIIPGVRVVSSLNEIEPGQAEFGGRDLFLCGGAQIYQQTLPCCTDLYLTLVKREVSGDTFFPAFEAQFRLESEVADHPEFKILHYRNSAPLGWPPS